MNNDELILSEIQDMRKDMVDMRKDIASMNTNLEVFKTKVYFGTKVITGIGAASATTISAIISWVIHHGLRQNP